MTIAYYKTDDGKLFTAQNPPDPIVELVLGIRQAHDILASRRHVFMSNTPDEVETILAKLLKEYEPVRKRSTTRRSVG